MDYSIDCTEALNDFISYVTETKIKPVSNKGYIYELSDGNRYNIKTEYKEKIIDLFKEPSIYDNSLIFGKDKTEKITAVDFLDDKIHLFFNDGTVKVRDFKPWILGSKRLGNECEKLEGDLHYNWKKTFEDESTLKHARSILYKKREDFYQIFDNSEAFMISEGVTLFKGLKVEEVSVLSMDIETTGIRHNGHSRVLLISNSFRDRSGNILRKLFSIDDYTSNREMLEEWAKWVVEIDPGIIVGHNLFGFDLPYLTYCYGEELPIGKYGEPAKTAQKPSKFRKDGSQEYEYFNVNLFGRQIIDTFFLSIKYDFKRKYENYKLKSIIEAEGLERKGRVKWDFSVMPGQIKRPSKEWDIFKKYCEDDADDALKLYDLMIPSFFYYTQSLPMSFQKMNNSATGRQINAFLVRSYIQEGHSIPKTSEAVKYGGGLSYGNHGLYSHVYKVDVASLYPSIMITEKIYDKEKDPKANFFEMVTYFTNERLQNKQRGKETGQRYYKDMEQAQKIFINSAYGLLGTPGLNFNSFANADLVTSTGRQILQKGIDWVSEKGYTIVNVDTDSFSYTAKKKLTDVEFNAEIVDINSRFKDGIVWENDGYYKKVIVVKAKNYVLDDGKKLTIKGSALKASNKERALQFFINDVIMLLLKNNKDRLFRLYNSYAEEINDIKDMTRWAMKKTITDAVLNPERTQEKKVFDAIQCIHYQEGDKVRLFSKDPDTLCLVENFDGVYDKDTYFKKLFDTLKVFEPLIDSTLFPNFKLSRNKELI